MDLQEEINALARKHVVMNQDKLNRRLKRIERMTEFYEEKAPIAPPAQGLMFHGFVNALIYAATIIKMYRKLTKRLSELAEDER